MQRKEENLTENHATPMVSDIYTKNQSMKKNKVYPWKAFCRKTKTKRETSNLRNLKIIPRKLNDIVLSWIPSQSLPPCMLEKVQGETAIFCTYSAGIFKQSMGARNRVGIRLSYRPARLHSLAELVSLESILGLLKSLKIRTQYSLSL
jgi:hypothetical protein